MPGGVRWVRLALAAAASAVTAVAALGQVGVLPAGSTPASATASLAATTTTTASPAPTRSSRADGAARTVRQAETREAPPTPQVGRLVEERTDARPPAAPDASGRGRRVVFDQTRQRVWLVGRGETVRRTYLVSGSVTDNLDPGTYAVYSRSRHAWGIDDSGTMGFFVRFTRGENAAIGFHDIPVLDGRPLQGSDELGTPTSHGCIRQERSDAKALWTFAPLGTTVVVTA